MIRVLVCGVLSVLSLDAILIAQFDSVFPVSLPVSTGGVTINDPFKGGLNSPQFSMALIDKDTCSDLFVFDRGGNFVMVFKGDCRNTPPTYTYDREAANWFPDMHDWALLIDFNLDKVPDIFTASDPGVQGIRVYRGKRDNFGNLDFSIIRFDQLPFPVLTYPAGMGTSQIYVSQTDIPAIADFDGDKDMDILTFDLDGSRLFYYKNVVSERRLSADTLVYELNDNCWGKALENFLDNTVILSDDPEVCPLFSKSRGLHAGSTVSAFDHDNDGDLDILLGDVSFPNLIFLRNGGSKDLAFIDMQIPFFPFSGTPVDISFFPGSYHVDIDQDGLIDFLASPNAVNSTENIQVTWKYIRNSGTSQFELIKKDFLVDSMLDFGINAYPHFVDLNGDHLIDLLVGSRYESGFNPQNPSRVFYFKNGGTSMFPSFTSTDLDLIPGELAPGEGDALKPCSGDLDNDGDMDIVIGNRRGKLMFIENKSLNGLFEKGAVIFPYFEIDVGSFASPQIFDLNKDGLLDLFVGEESGNINFFMNTGTVHVPEFHADQSFEGNTDFLGQIDTRQEFEFLGYSSPFIFDQIENSWLLSGSHSGSLMLYKVGIGITDPFLLVEPEFGGLRDGFQTSPDLADIDQDGLLELVCGNSRGGLTLYKTEIQAVATNQIDRNVSTLRIFPNPSRSKIYFTSDSDITGISYCTVLNINGHIIDRFSCAFSDGFFEWDISPLPVGLYVLFVKNRSKAGCVKFIVQD